VVTPDEERNRRNGHARERHKAVTENALLREARHEFADYTHGGQNPNVGRRVRVKPEQVLEENRVAAHRLLFSTSRPTTFSFLFINIV
jgi:hypothetical protein